MGLGTLQAGAAGQEFDEGNLGQRRCPYQQQSKAVSLSRPVVRDDTERMKASNLDGGDQVVQKSGGEQAELELNLGNEVSYLIKANRVWCFKKEQLTVGRQLVGPNSKAAVCARRET